MLIDNQYLLKSVGCVEVGNIFYEIYEYEEGIGYAVWCHEAGEEPTTWDELWDNKSAWIDYRTEDRQFESDEYNSAELDAACKAIGF